MSRHKTVSVIFFSVLALLFIVSTAHALTDMGIIHLSGRVKKLSGPVAVVEDRLVLLDPAGLQVLSEVWCLLER